MFSVDTETGTITISRGDTGAFRVKARTSYTFQTADRALFTIKDGMGNIVRQRIYEIDENKGFNVYFYNADTDSQEQTTFRWDVRWVINPYYDESGKIVDGDQVLTPKGPMQIGLLEVVGNI